MPSSPPPSSEPKASSRTKLAFSFIGAFCTLIIFFSYYKIFKRQCSARRGTPLRTRSRRQLLNEANPDDPSLQFHSRGLDSYILHSLPSMQFRKKSEDESGENNVDCTICLGEFEEGELLRLLPNCAHAFHVSCIDTWFESHSNCPLCRSHITYDFTGQHNYSASLFTLLETPRREEALQERATSNQILLTEIILHSAVRRT